MSKKTKLHIGVQDQDPERAYIVHAHDKDRDYTRHLDDVIEEIEGLARAIALDVIETRIVKFSKIDAGHFFSSGIRAEIADDIAKETPDIVIVNAGLSPVQQRNLETAWNAKVIDRTGLILEIFGERAQTKEGRLQVDLAALEYQRSRLVRSWTHLERQRGGAGFMGGPGERQIEIDRRLIDKQITRLKKELNTVIKTRDLGRQSRARVPFPIVSLVGYTNAGKSTLFNTITKADVFAEDLPFATLDPTMRRVSLPQNQDAILADTVGFISDLPTHLVAAFRATLEQIVFGDVIVHVIDVSREDYLAQKYDVIKILKDLDIDYENDERVIEVYNKADCLDAETLSDFQRDLKISSVPGLLISAITGDGIDILLDKIATITTRKRKKVRLHIPVHDGRALAWIYDHADILSRDDHDAYIIVEVSIDQADLKRFESQFSYRGKQYSE